MSYQSRAEQKHTGALPEPLTAGIDPFISRTYAYVLASLVGMSILGLISYYSLPKDWLLWLATADSILWILCGWCGWREPLALVFPLFSIVTGLVLGQLAHFYPSVFLSSAILTLVTFAALSAFVHYTKIDFSFLIGFLIISFFVLVGGSMLSVIILQPFYLHVLTSFGVIVFGCWILFDTSRVINRADDDLTPELAAFELILDIIGFHRWLLDLLDVWDSADPT